MKVFRHAYCLILIGELQALRRRGASLNCVRYARLPLEGATVVACDREPPAIRLHFADGSAACPHPCVGAVFVWG